ncbi:MAG: TonB-dependent receptor [Cytophagaceae bacterium]|jgi:iron complex outermembrane receptor protein|nr:TonB-dependent receptor [Cytophagaceae bacterium]
MKTNIILSFWLIGIISSKLFAQTHEIRGVVVDESKQPLIGAVVNIKNTMVGTSTDIDGKFALLHKGELPITLIVRSVGYQVNETSIDSISAPIEIVLQAIVTQSVVVTARYKEEDPQEIPIPITVIGGPQVEETGAFNVNRVKELVPSVQLYSSNPRNTGLNIRGLGSTFGLTNDGIDPGVGFYVDGVYYARPAATTLDFVDIDRIEVLRGPQGTLFGKNTTSGAFNITTRAASFTPGATFELSYGNYGYIQAKTSITGPLIKNRLAARASFSGTQRDGTIYNVNSQKYINDLNNLGGRLQFLYTPTSKIKLTLSGDYNQQRPEGYAQVIAGVVETQRPAYRQFNSIISDLNYSIVSNNPFDRKVDQNTTWRSGNKLGGVSLNAEFKIGKGYLTSISAWRYWDWDPSNDRDFTGLSALRLSQATSFQNQYSQELRYATEIGKKFNLTSGVFLLSQDIKSNPYQIEESGKDQWRFSQSTTNTALWSTPGLLDGYGIRTRNELKSVSAAVYAQLDWAVTDKLHVIPGLRYNYDEKSVDYERVTYGGLQTTDPALLAIQRSVYSNQAYTINHRSNQNISGQLTVSYKVSDKVNTYATYANGYKPIGVNIAGLPSSGGQPLLDLAVVKPEYSDNIEFGVKTTPVKNATFNVALFNTNVKDFQTNVQSPELGVNRGYLANAEKVRVFGGEVDASIRVQKFLTVNASVAYLDGKYVSFTNAPLPLEETGASVSFKDISGGRLPGISKWSGSVGFELSKGGTFLAKEGRFFVAFDTYFRSEFSSSPSPSKYLNIDGYSLVNGRLGFRATEGLSVFVWSRNLFNTNYFEQLLPASGNNGMYAGVLGDPRTYGTTIRYSF